MAAAKALGATAIKYPKPAGEEDPRSDDLVPTWHSRRHHRAADGGGSLGRRPRTLSRRSQGPAHPATGDEGVRLGLAQAAVGSRRVARRTARTGWCRSTTTRPCVRISSAVTSRSPTSSPGISTRAIARSFSTSRPSAEELTHTFAAFDRARIATGAVMPRLLQHWVTEQAGRTARIAGGRVGRRAGSPTASSTPSRRKWREC